MRDESTTDIRIVIELKTRQPQTVLNKLYKHTQLEETFHFHNMVFGEWYSSNFYLFEGNLRRVNISSEAIRRRTALIWVRLKTA